LLSLHPSWADGRGQKDIFNRPYEQVLSGVAEILLGFGAGSWLPQFPSIDKTCLIICNCRHFNPFDLHNDTPGRSKDDLPGGIGQAFPL
jgi:hypothetical protein